MAQLGIGVEFLHEFGKLEPTGARRTVEAVEKFSEHTHAGVHLEKLTNPRDARVRTIRIDQFWRGVVLAPDAGDQFVLLRVLPHDDAIDWARSRRFSVNPVSGILEVRDVVALEELTGPAPAPTEPDRLFASVGDADLRRLGIDDQVLAAARADHRRGDAGGDHAADAGEPGRRPARPWPPGYEVEQVWADVVAPRDPRRGRRSPRTSPPPSSARRAGSRWSTGPTSCSPSSPSRWRCGGCSCTRPRRRSPTGRRTGAARR